MKTFLRLSIAAAALAAAVPFASAQTTIIERRGAPAYVELTPSQRTVIYREVRRRPVAVAPQVELRVGAPIPQAVELYPVPEELYVEAPQLRRYRYFNVHNQVVLVDPETSEIVEIIRD
jgi:hypothetical protein